MEPLQNLVYYAAVVHGTTILAEQEDAGSGEFAQMAAKCLEHIPPLHNRFSYTTNYRMFISIIEGPFIYCAIMDEALSKAKAYMFLEHVRDSFMVLLQQKYVYPEALIESYSFHHEMDPFFRHLASSLVGIPQREKIRIKEEELLEAQRDAENDCEVSSPSAVAPLNDEDFDHKPMNSSSRSPQIPLIGKGKRAKKKTQEYDRAAIGSPMNSSPEALNKGKCCGLNKGNCLEIMVNDSSPCAHIQTQRTCWESARDRWKRNVKLVILLDVIVCILLLAIWLAVCEGVQCLKEN